MLHPVGSEPPSIYWRRRLILLGAVALVLVLIALTVSAVTGGGDTAAAGGSTGPSTRPVPSSSSSSSSSKASTSAQASRTTAPSSATTSPSTARSTTGGGQTSTAPPAMCQASNLKVAAVVGKPSYGADEKLLVELQVTNTGSKPCIQDLADKQVELRVYNGSSRVWGSHDCAVQPGTDLRTLAAGQPYRSGVLWGGLTSEPSCAQTTRQRIGAGTYTLYAALSGKTGTAAQFSVT